MWTRRQVSPGLTVTTGETDLSDDRATFQVTISVLARVIIDGAHIS